MTYSILAFVALILWLTGCVWLVERERRQRIREAEWSAYRRALIAIATPSPRPSLLGVEDAPLLSDSLRPVDGRSGAPSDELDRGGYWLNPRGSLTP